MSLHDYARKRDFGATPEPADGARKRRGKRPIFVIQLHHARARHYDLRLEVDGVLRSWAVPKGPSLRPKDKRLAVEVEDHPLSYADFSGTIPAGHYGAGDVVIFDHGIWSTQGDPASALAAGKLDFQLQGARLQGGWTLVRTAGKGQRRNWLLIKRNDAHVRDTDADALLDAVPTLPARSTSKPRSRSGGSKGKTKWRTLALALTGARDTTAPTGFAPQLASLRTSAPAGDDWLHEVKWDGYRLLADLDQGEVYLRSRNDQDWTTDLPEIAAAIRALPVDQACLDGELVALDADGKADFTLLQRVFQGTANATLHYLLFDLPGLADVDLRASPLLERKILLEQLLAHDGSERLAYSSHLVGHGAEVLRASAEHALEGIISKHVRSRYSAGRGDRWLKIKHHRSDEFVVIGYTAAKGARSGFGALLLADVHAGDWRYVGRVGTGFNDEQLRSLHQRMQSLHQPKPVLELPAHVPLSARSVQWLQPRLIVEVAFRGLGSEGLLRHSSFLRVREDKTPEDLGMVKASTKGAAAADDAVRISHPDRVIDAGSGHRKRDVADYYRAVADWLLPELIGRPLSLLRCPQGVGGECFFQKHHADSLGSKVQVVSLKEKSGAPAHYIQVDGIEAVIELVQMNTLEFHPWGARANAPERPDRLVFDLDPAPGISWPDIVAASREIRDRLAEVGLESFVRLSGGKGLHVLAPIRPGPDWASVREFCQGFAQAMVLQQPRRYIATMSKQARKGRIFIDWLRNARGATSIASWSLRARPGLPVAMPLRWSELGRIHAPDSYDLQRAMRRATSLRSDPWKDLAELDQQLPALESA